MEVSLGVSIWASRLKQSPTLDVKAFADQLREAGREVFDFGIGDMNPEVPVPGILKTAICEAINADATHYSHHAGEAGLLGAIAEDLAGFGLQYSPSQIVVCPGPKDALFKACFSTIDSIGDRNRIAAYSPIYDAYENIPILVTGKEPIVLPTSDGFLPDPVHLDKVLSSDSSIAGLIVNSPNNPTGAVYSRKLLREMAEVVSNYPRVCVFSDEVYRTVLFDGAEYTSIAEFLPEQTMVVGGMSKEVSGTGLRLGFVAGPPSIMGALAEVEGNTGSCVHLPTQRGYEHFLRNDRDRRLRGEICDLLDRRRVALIDAFEKAAQEAVWSTPGGAYFFFPDMKAYLGRRTPDGCVVETDVDLASYLAREFGVVAIPGSAFQAPGHLRFSYAVGFETIATGMRRLGLALKELS